VNSSAAIDQSKLALNFASATSTTPTATTVLATALVAGKRYRILSQGTTTSGNWATAGSTVSSNNGTVFQATGPTSGDGTATLLDTIQAVSGVASFDSANFEVNVNGWVGIKNGGVARIEMANLDNDSLMGNLSGSATYPQQVTTSAALLKGLDTTFSSSGVLTIATANQTVATGTGASWSGGAGLTTLNITLLPANIIGIGNLSSGQGVTGTNIPVGATVTSYTSGTNTLVIAFTSSTVSAGTDVTLTFTAPATQSYNITPITTTGVGSSIIKSAGDGSVNVQQLKVDGFKIIDTTSSTVEFYSPNASGAGFNFLTSTGTTAAGTTSVKNLLEVAGNTKIGTSATPATLEVTGTSTLTGAVTATAITTGAAGTNGDLTGSWTVKGASKITLESGSFNAISGTLYSDSLHTGVTPTVTAGSFIIGKTYKIVTPGSTNFVTIGAANSFANTVFTATGVGSGDGTAERVGQITGKWATGSATIAGPIAIDTWVDGATNIELMSFKTNYNTSASATARLYSPASTIGTSELAFGNAFPDSDPVFKMDVRLNTVTFGGSSATNLPTMTVVAGTTSGGVVSKFIGKSDGITGIIELARTSASTYNPRIGVVANAGSAYESLVFQTANSTTYTDRMTIDTNGLVTIANTLKTTAITTGSESTAGTITGDWGLTGKFQATYADLAEYYSADVEYEPGTVLIFGGVAEVTTTTIGSDSRVAGVVTTNPAYVMNSELQGLRACVALQGRVPVKVLGIIKKGDLITTSSIPGYACKAMNPQVGTIIGKAVADKLDPNKGIIEVAVGRL
jgi:hypothetical protein